MQARRPSAPKLHFTVRMSVGRDRTCWMCVLRNHPPATPKIREWDIAVLIVRCDAKPLLDLAQMLHDLSLLDDGALPAGPGT